MTDLGDIAALAYADEGAVCLIVAAMVSLFVGRRFKAGRAAAAAFAACWAYPFAALVGTYDSGVAMEAALEAARALPQDAIWLIARFAGMYVVIAVLWRARLALHGRKPVSKIEARAA